MDQLGSDEECGSAEPTGRRTIWEPKTQGSSAPMSQQRPIL